MLTDRSIDGWVGRRCVKVCQNIDLNFGLRFLQRISMLSDSFTNVGRTLSVRLRRTFITNHLHFTASADFYRRHTAVREGLSCSRLCLRVCGLCTQLFDSASAHKPEFGGGSGCGEGGWARWWWGVGAE